MLLSEIGERLGIDNRILRYVIERNLVPGISKVNKGRGRQRKLTVIQARKVGLVASLHQLGIQGEILQQILTKVTKDNWVTTAITIKTSSFSAILELDLSGLLQKIR